LKQVQTIEASPPKSKFNSKWLWSGGLFGLALLIRLVYALQLPFPPLDDPAYYVQGARSLFNGHPLELSIIWSYHPVPATVLHPGFDFWMPLTSFLIAGSFLILGDTTLAAQLPSVLAGSALPVLTFWLAWRVFRKIGLETKAQFFLAGGAGLYIALNPLLAYQSAVPDSQMIYATLVGAAALVWINRESPGQSLGLGLLMGLAYLTRSHAVFLIMAWAIVTLVRLLKEHKSRAATLKLAAFTVAGLALTAGPWLLRNWLTFHSLSSPAALESGLINNYATLFNYETPINFDTFLRQGLDAIFKARLNALYNAWVEVLGTMFVPTVLLPGAGLFLLWRRNRELVGRWLLYCLLLGLGLPLVFVAASSTGSFYHSSGSMAPFGAIGFVYLFYRASEKYRDWKPAGLRLFPVLLVALLAVELVQFGVSAGGTVSNHRHDQSVYARLGSWLAANQVTGPVISDEPSSLNYATGIPAVRLPSDEPLETVKRLAERYGATYIVVTGYFGRYPTALESTENNKIFPLAYMDPQGEFEIYRTK
jgi:hypothetical protein